MKAILTGALMALTITTARGAEVDRYIYSANNTLAYCKAFADSEVHTDRDVANSYYCAGMTSMLMYMAPYTQENDKACISIPVGASSVQVAKVIVRYGEVHPDRLHLALEALAIEALHSAWPCSKGR
jgi:hypothetical protein